MKRIFLIVAAATLLFTSCEKKCKAKIIAEDGRPRYVYIDGNVNTLVSNGTIEAPQGATIKIGYTDRIYMIEECTTYVIVKDGTKDILLRY